MQWSGRGFVFATVLATMMIPFPVLMVPLYLVFRELGWDRLTQAALGPRVVRWRVQYLHAAPVLPGHPAGARRGREDRWVLTLADFLADHPPPSRPALAVVALFHFIYVWNDFLGPLIFLTHRDQFTLALGLQLYQSQAGQTPGTC